MNSSRKTTAGDLRAKVLDGMRTLKVRRVRIPRTRLKGGVGHNLPQEAPKAFADAIIEVDITEARDECGGFEKDGASWIHKECSPWTDL